MKKNAQILAMFAVSMFLVACGTSELNVHKEGGVQLVYKLADPPGGGSAPSQYTEEIARVIERRLEELGIRRKYVGCKGSGILVNLPQMEDRVLARVKRIITTRGQFGLQIVDEDGANKLLLDLVERLPEPNPVKLHKERVSNGERGVTYSYYLAAPDGPDGKNGCQLLSDILAGVEIPPNRAFGLQRAASTDSAGDRNGEEECRTHYLGTPAKITGADLEMAMVLDDDVTNRPYVSLGLHQEGARKFAELTRENIRRRLAIVFDGKVNSTPVIQEEIPGGQVRISLGANNSYAQLFQEAQDIVIVLRSGVLPVPIMGVGEEHFEPAREN